MVRSLWKNVWSLSPGHKASKTYEIFWVIGLCFVTYNKPLYITPEFMLMKLLRLGPPSWFQNGVDHQKDQVIRKWELSAPLLTSGEGRKVGLKIKHYKNLWTRSLMSFWIGEHIEMLEGWCPGESSEALYPSPCTLPYPSLSSGCS